MSHPHQSCWIRIPTSHTRDTLIDPAYSLTLRLAMLCTPNMEYDICFQNLPLLLRATPNLSSLTTLRLLHARVLEGMDGFRPFLTSGALHNAHQRNARPPLVSRSIPRILPSHKVPQASTRKCLIGVGTHVHLVFVNDLQSPGYLVSVRVDAIHQSNVSFLRHLRQQALCIPAHLFPLPC